jgi:hypothetical protein
MQTTANILKNNNIPSAKGAPQVILASIDKASRKTGVDFAYLVNQAKAESSFNPTAKARTSSASGLYQFIERTWLDMVNRHGDKYGLDKYADAIDSKLRVGDRATRNEILALRNDPELASYMAAEFAAENKAFLERTVGGNIGATELYFAHFLGASGASGFLKELKHNPNTIAADIMPAAARANRNVFYDSKTGEPRTLGQVYAFFDKKFDKDDTAPQNMLAQANVPLPVRKPEITTTKASYQHIPHSLEKPVVFTRDAQAASLAHILYHRNDTLTLDDYRHGANQISPRAPLNPPAQSPLSIADLLMLSSVDL